LKHQKWKIDSLFHTLPCSTCSNIDKISDDDLLDILIRDPCPGYIPAVRDFVLVQQACAARHMAGDQCPVSMEEHAKTDER